MTKLNKENLMIDILTEKEKEIVICECCGSKNLWVDMPETSPTICFDCRGYFNVYPTCSINNDKVSNG